MPMQLLKRKFTVQQYHQMAESGILGEDERIELIRGEIVGFACPLYGFRILI
jgi:hypothetical protein